MELIISSIFLLVILFYTALRAAFNATLRLRLELLGRNKSPSGRAASLFLRETTMVSLSIKAARNIFLILWTLITFHALKKSGLSAPETQRTYLAFSIALAFLIFILADAIIANLSRLFPYAFLKALASPFLFSYALFWPLTRLLASIRRNILTYFGKNTASLEKKENLSEDFEELVNSLHLKNSLIAKEPEVQILQNALEFSEVLAGSCMIPRSEVVAMEINSPVEELIQKFTSTRLTRILIYRENIENIIGYVHSFEMFRKPVSIISVIRPVVVVPETIPVQDVLTLFIKQRRNIAVVVDEYGGTSGILTMEDVIEELFGEIDDEHDNDRLLEKQLNEKEFLFSARLEIDYLNEKYSFAIPSSPDYTTLGGFVMQLSQGLPRPKQKLFTGRFRLEVVEMADNRIETVKLILK